MVNIPQGGMHLHTAGRGVAHQAGATAPRVAGHGGPTGRAGTVSPPSAAREGRSPQPAVKNGQTAWSAARLVATILRILAGQSAESTLRILPGPPAYTPAKQTPTAQSRAETAAQPRPPAGAQLIAALLRILAGPTPASPAQSGSHASLPAEQSAETTQAPPRLSPDTAAVGPRAELTSPTAPMTAAVGLPPAAAAPGAPVAPDEHPSPRAELVPPGDGVRSRNGTDLPIVPAALVALALPALAAVLASVF